MSTLAVSSDILNPNGILPYAGPIFWSASKNLPKSFGQREANLKNKTIDANVLTENTRVAKMILIIQFYFLNIL